MRPRERWLVGLLLVAWAAIAAVGNVPPTMDDQYVTTVQNTPVTFALRAQDEDIDPDDPEAHPLRFVLLEGPNHGVLIGDMTAVTYEGPNDAVIELTYVPATGFVGSDLVTVAVFDPFDETTSGTVAIRIDVTARREVGLLSGNWALGMTYIPESGSISAFQTQLTEVYRIGQLTMKGIAGWGMTSLGGMKKAMLNALRLEGDAKLSTVSVASTLAFDPDAASPAELFDYWRATMGFGLGGVKFRHTVYLTKPVTSSYQTLYGQARMGSVSFTNTLRFDVNADCEFAFGRNETAVGWSGCDRDLSATLAVTCDGFQQAVLKVSDLRLAPEYLPGLTLDSRLTYTVEAKTLSTTLEWRPGWVRCIRAYGELSLSGANSLEIDGVSIYGLLIAGEVGGARVESATSLEETRNSSVTGKSDYFEVVRTSGMLMGCCGLTGTWRTATYFSATSSKLFDWGMTTGSFELGLTDDLSANAELVLRSGDLGDPTVELSFGWTVRW